MRHHFNLTQSEANTVTPRYVAARIKKGVAAQYAPSFEQGDKATELFAKDSKEALEWGGVVLAYSQNPDKASVVRTMSILQGVLNKITR